MVVPVGLALLAIGVLTVAAGPMIEKVLGVVIGVLGLGLLGIALGLVRSADMDDHEAAVDVAIREATSPCGSVCGTESCGTSDCAVKALPRL